LGEWITVLSHEVDLFVLIHGDDTDRDVLEMNDAVNAFVSVRPNHLIFANPNPGIVVNEARRNRSPGVALIPSFSSPLRHRFCSRPGKRVGCLRVPLWQALFQRPDIDR
jgi:hypothetical protein